jgi:hypothetical protein
MILSSSYLLPSPTIRIPEYHRFGHARRVRYLSECSFGEPSGFLATSIRLYRTKVKACRLFQGISAPRPPTLGFTTRTVMNATIVPPPPPPPPKSPSPLATGEVEKEVFKSIANNPLSMRFEIDIVKVSRNVLFCDCDLWI